MIFTCNGVKTMIGEPFGKRAYHFSIVTVVLVWVISKATFNYAYLPW